MGKIEKIREKLIDERSSSNFSFSDIQTLLLHIGFSMRIRGSHHIFTKKEVRIPIILQPIENGKVKHYQIAQIRKLFKEVGL